MLQDTTGRKELEIEDQIVHLLPRKLGLVSIIRQAVPLAMEDLLRVATFHDAPNGFPPFLTLAILFLTGIGPLINKLPEFSISPLGLSTLILLDEVICQGECAHVMSP